MFFPNTRENSEFIGLSYLKNLVSGWFFDFYLITLDVGEMLKGGSDESHGSSSTKFYIFTYIIKIFLIGRQLL